MGRLRKKKETAEEEEVDLLEVYHVYEFLSPVATRVTIFNSVQADDSVVPVNFVPISPITFVHAVSSSSVSSSPAVNFTVSS